jgi:hypothetical protein
MNIRDIDENFNFLLSSLLIWLNGIRHPFMTCQSILDQDISDNDKLRHAMRLWLVASVIGLIMQLPAYRLFGIELSNIAFHLPNCLYLLVMFLSTMGIIHLGLRMYKIHSDFTDTLVMYSVLVGCFSPVITILFYPQLIELISTLREVKSLNLDFEFLVKEFISNYNYENFSAKPVTIQIYWPIASSINFAVYATLLVMFGRLVSVRYSTEKYRVLSAIGFSLSILFPIQWVVLMFFYFFILYAAL